MATEFKDYFGVVESDPAGSPQIVAFKNSYAEAIALAEDWAESDTYGIKYAVISMLGIAKVV